VARLKKAKTFIYSVTQKTIESMLLCSSPFQKEKKGTKPMQEPKTDKNKGIYIYASPPETSLPVKTETM
jgi:hypothetical protein